MKGRGQDGLLAVLMMMLALIGLPGEAHAASVESLLEPGRLAAAHHDLESRCAACHDRSARTRQNALCLSCHKDVAADLRAARGYHGRMPNAGAGQCTACHSEHRGVDADIVGLSPGQFDHRLTDFALTGAHRTLGCSSCHAAGAPWRNAASSCQQCHHADDVHAGQLGASCASCHGTEAWSGARFDHASTRFTLTGAHAALACDACHLGGRYAGTPRTCVGCHAPDDVHAGARGSDCAHCHNSTAWSGANFDHARDGGFALLGRHAQVQCAACHRGGDYQHKLPTDCVGCHRADDDHAGRFGARCEQCHDNEDWHRVDYDHGQRTGFVLQGAHRSLDCDSCHTASLASQHLGRDCVDCHRAEDAHGGALGAACDRCHGQVHWDAQLRFDHDLTSFPLLGLHAVLSCAQCHRTRSYQGAPLACSGCHAAQDVHHGNLGRQCERCHSPNGWAIWVFDHDAQTHFPLTGAHRSLACAQCHRQAPGSGGHTPSDCVACHRNDDRHLGQFGIHCDRCHGTATFRGAHLQ